LPTAITSTGICIPRRFPLARRDNSKLESFDRSALVFGDRNETVLKLAAGPQIAPVYGTDFRSTSVFFLQDGHDYFDNDEAFDEMSHSRLSGFSSNSRADAANATRFYLIPRPSGLRGGSVGAR
jgi:hypothetical protein